MEKVKRISITFNLENPKHKEQWDYLCTKNSKIGTLRDGLDLLMDGAISIHPKNDEEYQNTIKENELDNEGMIF